jgi:phosphoadenosine phosphosulfate reductase
MWCRFCNKETADSICSTCGNEADEEIPHVIYWCYSCNMPFIEKGMKSNETRYCPNCHTPSKRTFEDLRPVFPEERLLLELLLKKVPFSLAHESVWMTSSTYVVNGKTIRLPSGCFEQLDVDSYRLELSELQEKNCSISYPLFDEKIRCFIDINRQWLNDFTQEACEWVDKSVLDPKYKGINLIVSFSGGKDSTAVSDVVMKALANPRIIHLFGDTTLEFPLTYDYIEQYHKEHPLTPMRHIKNSEQNFLDVCDDIGPPARMMRWCCSMFKTGPITRKLNQMCRANEGEFSNKNRVLTFYGIRKCESVSRSKYERIVGTSESIKIQKQVVGSPIFFWKDIDVWLYLLANHISFNPAYRLGYDRVGCWCCPNNSNRAQFLSRIYMPTQSSEWRSFLIDFAKKIGKPDPEVYVDGGWWKARQGGEGLSISSDIKIKYSNCTTEDNAKVFQLTKPLDETLYNLFVPFGNVKEGRLILHEKVVLDVKTSMQIISIIPFSQSEYVNSVKIRVTNIQNVENLFRQIAYQIRKYNACRQCLKCESICKYGAISITKIAGYQIDPNKCKHCLKCVNQKYLTDGCLMGKYLRVRNGSNDED